MTERGKYIVIEGHDGTGKSLQAQRLRQHLAQHGIKLAQFRVEEPDGATTDDEQPLVPMASELRKIIKNGTLDRDPLTNVLLFTAARRLNWLNAIHPALRDGLTVVTTRNFVSTIAYQGYGEGFSIEDIETRTETDVGSEYLHPDLTIILSLGSHAARKARIANRGDLETPDAFESRQDDFQERVRLGYEAYAHSRGIPIVDASGTPEEVEQLVWDHIKGLLLLDEARSYVTKS